MIVELNRLLLVSSLISIVSTFIPFSDRVPFKYKRKEPGSAGKQKRLAVPLHSRFRSAVEDNDYYDDDIEIPASNEMYDNDSAQNKEDTKIIRDDIYGDLSVIPKSDEVDNSALKDNDNTLDRFVKQKSNQVGNGVNRDQVVKDELNNITNVKTNSEEADYKDTSAEMATTVDVGKADQKDATTKNIFMNNVFHALSNKISKKHLNVDEKIIEEQHRKEDLSSDKWQPVRVFTDKYGYISAKPFDYDYDQVKVTFKDKYKVKPLLKTKKTTKKPKTKSRSKKRKHRKKGKKKKVTEPSVSTITKTYVDPFSDKEKSTQNPTEISVYKPVYESKTFLEDNRINEAAFSSAFQSHSNKHAKAHNDSVRLKFIPMNFGENDDAPTLFFPVPKQEVQKLNTLTEIKKTKKRKKNKNKGVSRYHKDSLRNGSMEFTEPSTVTEPSTTTEPPTETEPPQTIIIYLTEIVPVTEELTTTATFPTNMRAATEQTSTFPDSKDYVVRLSDIKDDDEDDEKNNYVDYMDQIPLKGVLFTESDFGRIGGEIVRSFSWRTESGFEVTVISYGAIITSIKVPDRNNTLSDVVLGFDDLSSYLTMNTPDLLGAVVGRCVGRISNARFEINGQVSKLSTNCGAHHLHGGYKGFDKQNWSYTTINNKVVFSLLSKDGTEGYPGDIIVNVSYEVTNDDTLHVEYTAITNKPTVVNLSNHSYFNLAGHETGADGLMEHNVVINSNKIVDADADWIPTGRFQDVGGTPFDLRTPKRLGDVVSNKDELRFHHNFVIAGHNDSCLNFVSRVEHPMSGRFMEVFSNQPSVIFYTGNYIQGQGHPDLIGKGGVRYGRCAGMCLETMNLVDAVNHKEYPSPVLFPGDTYKHSTTFRFGAI